MKQKTTLALVSALCITFGTLAGSSVSAAPSTKPATCRTQKECQKAYRQFFDIQKTIKLNVTKGLVIAEPDGKNFTVTKSSKFAFVGFLELSVNGSGSVEKSFPNGESGGKVTFDGAGTIRYNDSGEVVFEAAKDRKLQVTADKVTKVVLLDNTSATATNCTFVYAYRNSIATARDCDYVSAYTEAQVTVERCKKTEAHDNAKVTEIQTDVK